MQHVPLELQSWQGTICNALVLINFGTQNKERNGSNFVYINLMCKSEFVHDTLHHLLEANIKAARTLLGGAMPKWK